MPTKTKPNKPKVKIGKMNITSFITMSYEQRTMNYEKNKPKQTQTKPISRLNHNTPFCCRIIFTATGLKKPKIHLSKTVYIFEKTFLYSKYCKVQWLLL